MKNILITGGTGLIGKALTKLLLHNGYNVAHLSRRMSGKELIKTYHWDIGKNYIEEEAIGWSDTVIHLAGEGVFEKRWNEQYKKQIIESRVKTTSLLFEKLPQAQNLHTFISASGVGIYGGNTGNEIVNEMSLPANDFLAKVVKEWEKAADKFSNAGIRTVKIRIGIVLSDKGGALGQLITPIKLGLGSPIGKGDQYFPWIHIEDLVRIFMFAIENSSLHGVFNAASPGAVTNKEFINKAAKILHKPLWFPSIPKTMIKILFGTEKATFIVGGNRVSSKKIENEGFKFRFNSIQEALSDLL